MPTEQQQDLTFTKSTFNQADMRCSGLLACSEVPYDWRRTVQSQMKAEVQKMNEKKVAAIPCSFF